MNFQMIGRKNIHTKANVELISVQNSRTSSKDYNALVARPRPRLNLTYVTR